MLAHFNTVTGIEALILSLLSLQFHLKKVEAAWSGSNYLTLPCFKWPHLDPLSALSQMNPEWEIFSPKYQQGVPCTSDCFEASLHGWNVLQWNKCARQQVLRWYHVLPWPTLHMLWIVQPFTSFTVFEGNVNTICEYVSPVLSYDWPLKEFAFQTTFLSHQTFNFSSTPSSNRKPSNQTTQWKAAMTMVKWNCPKSTNVQGKNSEGLVHVHAIIAACHIPFTFGNCICSTCEHAKPLCHKHTSSPACRAGDQGRVEVVEDDYNMVVCHHLKLRLCLFLDW